MNFREAYLQTLLFGQPERVPLIPGEPRESTLAAWRKQGLPEGVDYFQALPGELGLPPMVNEVRPVDVSFAIIPTFEEKTLERKERSVVVQDWMGAITEISDEYDYTYLHSPKDFVTRKWHRFPVQTRQDWERMKERYQADTPERIPADLAGKYPPPAWRELVLSLEIGGPFWQLREWCGFENLCMLFADAPEFVEEMVALWTDFVSEVLVISWPNYLIYSRRLAELLGMVVMECYERRRTGYWPT